MSKRKEQLAGYAQCPFCRKKFRSNKQLDWHIARCPQRPNWAK